MAASTGCSSILTIAFLCILGYTHAQQIHLAQGINHPAAGPDFGQGEFARNFLNGNGLDDELDEFPDALIDPEGRKIVAPHKAHREEREKELREEAEEIARILSQPEETISSTPSTSLRTWFWALFGCGLVVMCGILPAFLLPRNSSDFLQTPEGKKKLNLLLSFAVGSLLGDVFLHLLPETWASHGVDMVQVGTWTIGGLLVCFFVEKLCATTEDSQHQVCAIMNLAGNMIDNFTHGLAVGGSFLVGVKFGLLTTFAILIHEIPHEVSDFAILLRADYNRVQAMKAQLVTASGGVIGACLALYMHTDTFVSGGVIGWILPFTAGGFINIALAQILPELMQEKDKSQNLLQLLLIIAGVVSMGLLSQMHVAL